jgi:hypothetical protein
MNPLDVPNKALVESGNEFDGGFHVLFFRTLIFGLYYFTTDALRYISVMGRLFPIPVRF